MITKAELCIVDTVSKNNTLLPEYEAKKMIKKCKNQIYPVFIEFDETIPSVGQANNIRLEDNKVVCDVEFTSDIKEEMYFKDNKSISIAPQIKADSYLVGKGTIEELVGPELINCSLTQHHAYDVQPIKEHKND